LNDRPERQHDLPRRPGPAPRFTVIVPTFERPAPLAACVRALRALERPGGALEIVIVNDGGSPPPPDVVDAGGDTTLQLRVIDQRNAGPASARNRGAAEAQGEYLAFTDDDCLPDRGWLTASFLG